jgi:hypothetical protein
MSKLLMTAGWVYLVYSCRWETPNSRWGDTGSDCAVGRQHPSIIDLGSVSDWGAAPLLAPGDHK